MNLHRLNKQELKRKKDNFLNYDFEDQGGYEELRMQTTETGNIEQISDCLDVNHPIASKRRLKAFLVVLLIIILICGLTTIGVLFGLETRKLKEIDMKQLSQPLIKDEFMNNPCRSKSKNPKLIDQGKKEWGSRGRSFLVSFLQNHNKANETNRTIIVSSETDFDLIVSLPENQRSNLISISTLRSRNVTLKKLDVHHSLVPSYNTTESKAIIINTSVRTSVLSVTKHDVSSDTTTVFPIDKLSTDYIISTATPTDKFFGSGSHFTIAAMKDNTIVSIVFKADHDIDIVLQGKSYGSGDTFNVILNKYQTFQIGLKADMTGTMIRSSNPVAVFAGNRCLAVGYLGYCSMLMEMVPPADKLDYVFIVPPNIHRYQSQVRILSAVKTKIKFTTKDMKTTGLLLKDRFADFIIREHEVGVVYSTEPILVNSIALASTKTNIYGDPFMVTIPGINQYLNEYINVVPDGFTFNFATFMIRNDSLRSLQINGTNMNIYKCLFHSSVLVGTDLYSVCTVSVPFGVIDVKTSDGSRFGFIVTGQRKNDGHGYAGNALLTASCGT
ncbi:IgGFc-binding protein-like [Saccostrea cucullata]|uniref:IgGFc-binding protein-like n=1 Tax=Saccostrea cuccullata TaxID=36930 RepID=UPI002ED256F7